MIIKLTMKRTNLVCCGARPLFFLDPTFPNEKQNCVSHDEKFANVRAARSETGHIIHADNFLEFSALRRLLFGITTSQPHTDQKPTELPKTQSIE